MNIIKVRKSAYLRLRQADLIPFAKNVFNRMSADATYAELETSYKNVELNATNFENALVASQEGGKPFTATKNQAKKELIDSLNILANLLDNQSKGDPLYILNAGMELQKKGTRTVSENIPMPDEIIVNTTLNPGTVEVKYSLPKVSNMVGVAAEWTPITETNWTNGTYFSKASKKGKLNNLPSMTEIFVRLRTICEDGLNSHWSEEVRVKVL